MALLECFSEMKTSEGSPEVWSVPMGRHSSDRNLLRIKSPEDRAERKEERLLTLQIPSKNWVWNRRLITCIKTRKTTC